MKIQSVTLWRILQQIDQELLDQEEEIAFLRSENKRLSQEIITLGQQFIQHDFAMMANVIKPILEAKAKGES